MKASETILADFIIDLNLELPGIGVCFTATIEFNTASIFKKFNSDVHIITMMEKQLTFVYLLHPQLAEFGIPDVFPFNEDNFFYNKNESLVIKDYDLLRGKYKLSIYPVNSLIVKPCITFL